MIYADYNYYSNDYGGVIIPEVEFKRVIKKVSRYIDRFTFGRITEGEISNYPPLPDCACEMAETVYRMQGSSGTEKEKKSEEIDGYSVTYVTEGKEGELAEDRLKNKLYSIAELYLINTGLLYCGVDTC